jgi:hypothetical protein
MRTGSTYNAWFNGRHRSGFAWFHLVDPRTVRRWIEKGALQIRRTPGGGIRIILTS